VLDPRRIAGMARAQPESSRWASSLGIVEIIVILAVALIVIPPENLPDVMRAAGKILRELRLASNMVVRELSGALDQPSEDHPAPPINTMKPSAIAQSAAPADPAAPADLKRSADLAVACAPTSASSAPADASSESTAAEPAPAGPKATD
jgi:Sec-independent protein translocase protein TatA